MKPQSAHESDVVCYSKSDIIHVLKQIEGIVVSLHDLTMAHADLSPDHWKEAVFEYFLKSEALKAMPNCRRLLSMPFPSNLGEDDMSELERAMQDAEYWSFSDFVKRRKLDADQEPPH